VLEPLLEDGRHGIGLRIELREDAPDLAVQLVAGLLDLLHFALVLLLQLSDGRLRLSGERGELLLERRQLVRVALDLHGELDLRDLFVEAVLLVEDLLDLFLLTNPRAPKPTSESSTMLSTIFAVFFRSLRWVTASTRLSVSAMMNMV